MRVVLCKQDYESLYRPIQALDTRYTITYAIRTIYNDWLSYANSGCRRPSWMFEGTLLSTLHT